MNFIRKKQFFFLFLIFLLLLALPGCSEKWRDLTESEIEYTARIGEELALAIEAHDREKLESMFSVEALTTVTKEDLDAGFQYLFDTYKGTFISVSHPLSASSSTLGEPYNYKFMLPRCIITTTEGEFKIFFPLYKKFDCNKDVIGIYSLRLHLADEEVIYDRNYPGIYHPEWESRPEFGDIHGFITKKYIDPYIEEIERRRAEIEAKKQAHAANEEIAQP